MISISLNRLSVNFSQMRPSLAMAKRLYLPAAPLANQFSLFSTAIKNKGPRACNCNKSRINLVKSDNHLNTISGSYHQISRHFTQSQSLSRPSSEDCKKVTEGETQLKNTIRKCFPKATEIIVEDISGGCGSMYQIYIEAPDFKGLTTVKQHLLVNNALKKEIKSMHGIRIQTAVPKHS